MVSYRISYWLGGDVKVVHLEAPDIKTALVIFYTHYSCDGVIDIVEQSA